VPEGWGGVLNESALIGTFLLILMAVQFQGPDGIFPAIEWAIT
jgi:hypothetical protein